VYTYGDLEARWKALRQRDDVSVREVACVGAPRTLLCVETGSSNAPGVVLSAGIHGDERSGPWALLHLVESNRLDPRYAYRIWPCTNPGGYRAGTRENSEGADVNRSFGRGGQTPEARAIVTATRDRKFELSLDLHEDCDATELYCYEYGVGDVGESVASGAVLRPDPVDEVAEIGGLSYTLFVVRHAAKRALTLEAPGKRPWERRVELLENGVTAAIEALSQASG
jgi:hypothetical protein